MAAASTISNLSSGFKTLFPDARMEQLGLINRDLLKWVAKKDDLEGNGLVVAYRYDMPQGLGSKFATAQANVTSGKVKNVTLYRKRYYGFVTIDSEAARAARSNKGSFYRVKEAEIEDMTQMVSQELEVHLWRDGNGNKGQISSITDANPSVITLVNAEDVANFHIGEIIGCNSAADASGTDRTGPEAVAAIDIDAGTVTMTSNVYNDHAWDNPDYLFRNSGLSTTNDGADVVNGIAAWIPLTAETSGTFLGMNRLDSVNALQGYRQTFVGSIEETIKKLHSKMRRFGKMPDAIWLSNTNWHRLEQELGARAVREDGSPGTFGLPTLKYNSPNGPIRVYAGAFCPDGLGYMLKRSTWVLHHLDGLPHLITDDGKGSDRGSNYDGIEVRVRYWCELCCHDMSQNGVFQIS